MDRDRDNRRPLDIPPEDRYGSSRGQSYRPGAASSARSPPRADTYRTARSPPPPRRSYVPAGRVRSRSPLPRADTYRRARSPSRDRYRDGRTGDRDVRGGGGDLRDRDSRGGERELRGGDSYRARPRSPVSAIRREDLPRDDLFRREPDRERERERERDARRDYRSERDFRDERPGFRDERDYRDDRAYSARSPAPRYRERERSPLPLKRGREPSPLDSRGRRTPPPAKRERLASPAPRDRYDDYPASRGASPPRRAEYSRERTPPARGVTRGYRRADSRSPIRRNESIDPRSINDWRRPAARSPSPPRAARQAYDEYDDRGRESVATSRRSSPPVHPSRLGLQPADDRSARAAPRDSYDSREPYRAARSPEPRSRRDPSPLPPARDQPYADERSYEQDDRVPPPREAYRADDPPARAPPTGPSGGYRAPSSSMAPPTGPAAAQVSVSAHARAPVAPPSGPRSDMAPRGGFGGPRGRGGFGNDFAPRGRGGPAFGGPGFRGGRGGAGPGFGRGQNLDRGEQQHQQQQQQDFSSPQAPPSGPRGSFSSQQQQPPTPTSYRGGGNSSTATATYPRTQRFGPGAGSGPPDTPTGPRATSTPSGSSAPYRRPTEPSIPTGPSSSSQSNNQPQNIPTGPSSSSATTRRVSDNAPHPSLRNLPSILPNGAKAAPLIDRSRLEKLGEETERLRRLIDEKELRKRKVLREWERMGRESEGAGLRSELAEEALAGLQDETGMSVAF